MAVDFVAEALAIKPLIDDELFFQYQGLNAVEQKNFLDQLNENELINIKLRLDKSFYGSDETFTEAFLVCVKKLLITLVLKTVD